MMGDVVTAAGMLLALLCILTAAWADSRFLGRRFGTPSSGRSLKVLEQLPLGAGRSLLVVQYHDTTYLLGSSQSEIRLLDKIKAEEESSDE